MDSDLPLNDVIRPLYNWALIDKFILIYTNKDFISTMACMKYFVSKLYLLKSHSAIITSRCRHHS